LHRLLKGLRAGAEMDERLVANIARFAHDTLSDETILIDAETGHVILLTGFASVLWDHLASGATSEGLISAVDARFGTEAGSVTRNFLQELRAAEIIIPGTLAEPAITSPPAWPDHFTAPVLERYDDIAKIMTMDPIHDVGPGGWPQPTKNSNE
jgi:hypothetical protein